MTEEIEYKFLKNVDVENRVVGEFYIAKTLKLGKWSGKNLDCRSLKKEKEKFEIWKKENKDLFVEKPIEYKFLKDIGVENRVKGEFYISGTLKLGKWSGKELECRHHKKEKEKFEIWKKENKDICMERPKNPKNGDIYTRGGVEFRHDGKIWRSEEGRENNRKAAAAYSKTPEGRKSIRISKRKTRGIEFKDKAQEEEVDDKFMTATHCNNCETCKLTRHPEPFSNDTACLDHSYLTRLPRQIICQNCNIQEAYLRRVNKWKKDDPNFTRFALINDKPIYLSI